MSTRRQARAKTPVDHRLRGGTSSTGDGVGGQNPVPRTLLLGRCIEVWAEPGINPPSWSATRRFNLTREKWAAAVELSADEARSLVADGSPWSIEDPGADDRFARIDANATDDLDDLRDEADQLFADVGLSGGSAARQYRRRHDNDAPGGAA